MEGKDREELEAQAKRAEEELSKLPAEEKVILEPVLHLQRQRDELYTTFLSELRALEYPEKANQAQNFQKILKIPNQLNSILEFQIS